MNALETIDEGKADPPIISWNDFSMYREERAGPPPRAAKSNGVHGFPSPKGGGREDTLLVHSKWLQASACAL